MSAAPAIAATLLEREPYGPRDDAELLAELNALTAFHREACPPYARLVGEDRPAASLTDVPWVHATVFKHAELRSTAEGSGRGRLLTSSSTSGRQPSAIPITADAQKLQAQSTTAILEAFVGASSRPLLVLDSPRSLRSRTLSARLAAALALRPLSSDMHLLLEDAEAPSSLRWDAMRAALEGQDELLVYGFTWMLWLAWAEQELPEDIAAALSRTRVDFVHSGGWKKLESIAVGRERFDDALLATVAPGSRVVDYYGLVEQIGVVFPLCEHGFRHAPVWAEVIARDPWTAQPVAPEQEGMLQLLNPLALGAPHHSVLTEDLGRVHDGPCPCGRQGRRFTLSGRIPKAEVRGCANV